MTIWTKKIRVAVKVKENIFCRTIHTITENAAKSTSNRRVYWRWVKKLNKSSGYPLKIRDPKNPSIIIDNPKDIKIALTEYWSTIGNNKSTIKGE